MSGIAHGLHALFVFESNGFSMLSASSYSIIIIYTIEKTTIIVTSIVCCVYIVYVFTSFATVELLAVILPANVRNLCKSLFGSFVVTFF